MMSLPSLIPNDLEEVGTILWVGCITLLVLVLLFILLIHLKQVIVMILLIGIIYLLGWGALVLISIVDGYRSE